MSSSHVELRDLAQRLGGRWALRGVELDIDSRELVAVVGHNGSGKTTLLRVICTALRPTRGDGSVLGHGLRDNPDAVRNVVAMLSHGGGHYADLTAFENLEFAERMMGKRVDRVAIRTALEWCGLARVSHMRVRNFSSGMKRRLALATVKLREVPLLLMDEPFNSLDPDGSRLVDELLVETKARGASAIVVLHDVARSALTFDRTIELRDGRIVADARPIAAIRPPLTVAR